ncbi:MAG TPA: ABC transporter permease [Candidatus Mailhella merdavium]|nr:ABC transporter permease [Candidatus Mailhella merdavium]
MGFERFIASRYLMSRRKQTIISVISLMSVLGVAIGVAALVVVMGVYNGFTSDIRDKILGANAHVTLLSADPAIFDPVDRPENAAGTEEESAEAGTEQASPLASVLAEIQAVPGVKAATPYIYTEVLLSTARGATGLVVRGVDPLQAGTALQLLRDMPAGDARDLAREGVPGIVIGKNLAARFGLTVGSRVNLLSPMGQRSATGFTPKIRSFRVVGMFSSGMTDYDSRLAYISLDAARELLGLPEGRVSGIEAFCEDPYQAREIAATIQKQLGPPFYAQNWMDLNASLFAALQLERIGMFIVLAMVILVGSFSIITSLVMLVMEKTRDIAILMSMGATAGAIRRIFMLQGLIIGMVGTGIGYVLGLGLAWLLKKYQFIDLPPGVYTMDKLPMLIDVSDTLLIGVVAMIMCFLATIYPARQAARLKPAEALRYE